MSFHRLFILLSTTCISILLVFSVSAFPQDMSREAMFGLSWGLTTSEVKDMGVILTKEKGDMNLDTYSSASLPKNLSEIESYRLTFSEDRLVKIAAYSKNIINDPTGSLGKEKFENLKEMLVNKYGTPSLNEQAVGYKLYTENDEFYQCLAYGNCGMWASCFENKSKSICLALSGLKRGTGFLRIDVEGIPDFGNALGCGVRLAN